MRASCFLLALVLVTGISVATSTPSLRGPARDVPVYEETASPGTASNYYPLCSTVDNSAFALKIAYASNECAAKTSYNWEGLYSPTTAQRQELCSCTRLINQLQQVLVPRCSLYKDGVLVSYGQVIKYAFGLCSVGGSSSSTTAADSNSANTNNASTDVEVKAKKSSSSKAPVIGGVSGGVVASILGALGFKKYQKKKKSAATDGSSDVDASSSTEVQAKSIVDEPLSPLASSSSSTHYTKA